MWHNLPFSKRNKATERAARVEVEGDRKEWGGGWGDGGLDKI